MGSAEAAKLRLNITDSAEVARGWRRRLTFVAGGIEYPWLRPCLAGARPGSTLGWISAVPLGLMESTRPAGTWDDGQPGCAGADDAPGDGRDV